MTQPSVPVYRNALGRRVGVVPPPSHRAEGQSPGTLTVLLLDYPHTVTWQVPESFLAGQVLEATYE